MSPVTLPPVSHHDQVTPTIPTVPESVEEVLALEVDELTFAYSQIAAASLPAVLHNVTLNLKKGSRCILVGSNGAG